MKKNSWKLKANQYSNILMIFLLVLFLISSLYLPFAILFLLWYFLYGLTLIAQLCLLFNAERTGYFFTVITCPFLLLPFSRAWYYLLRSVFAVTIKKDWHKSLLYARRVHVNELISDNNKCFYYGQLASLCYDLEDIENARKYLELARNTDHRAGFDEKLAELDMLINGEAEEV